MAVAAEREPVTAAAVETGLACGMERTGRVKVSGRSRKEREERGQGTSMVVIRVCFTVWSKADEADCRRSPSKRKCMIADDGRSAASASQTCSPCSNSEIRDHF